MGHCHSDKGDVVSKVVVGRSWRATLLGSLSITITATATTALLASRTIITSTFRITGAAVAQHLHFRHFDFGRIAV